MMVVYVIAFNLSPGDTRERPYVSRKSKMAAKMAAVFTEYTNMAVTFLFIDFR